MSFTLSTFLSLMENTSQLISLTLSSLAIRLSCIMSFTFHNFPLTWSLFLNCATIMPLALSSHATPVIYRICLPREDWACDPS